MMGELVSRRGISALDKIDDRIFVVKGVIAFVGAVESLSQQESNEVHAELIHLVGASISAWCGFAKLQNQPGQL